MQNFRQQAPFQDWFGDNCVNNYSEENIVLVEECCYRRRCIVEAIQRRQIGDTA